MTEVATSMPKTEGSHSQALQRQLPQSGVPQRRPNPRVGGAAVTSSGQTSFGNIKCVVVIIEVTVRRREARLQRLRADHLRYHCVIILD